jgi:alpha-galactosidase
VINTKNTVVWLAQAGSGGGQYLAVFNLTESKADIRYGWKELELSGSAYKLRDLWEHKDIGSAGALAVTLPPHACMLYRLSSVRDAGR